MQAQSTFAPSTASPIVTRNYSHRTAVTSGAYDFDAIDADDNHNAPIISQAHAPKSRTSSIIINNESPIHKFLQSLHADNSFEDSFPLKARSRSYFKKSISENDFNPQFSLPRGKSNFSISSSDGTTTANENGALNNSKTNVFSNDRKRNSVIRRRTPIKHKEKRYAVMSTCGTADSPSVFEKSDSSSPSLDDTSKSPCTLSPKLRSPSEPPAYFGSKKKIYDAASEVNPRSSYEAKNHADHSRREKIRRKVSRVYSMYYIDSQPRNSQNLSPAPIASIDDDFDEHDEEDFGEDSNEGDGSGEEEEEPIYVTLSKSKDSFQQLFDQAVVVSLIPTDDKSSLRPAIVYAYPPLEENSLNIIESIPQFCFPDENEWQTDGDETFLLIFTNESGDRSYGYCRKMSLSRSPQPEVFCLLSSHYAYSFFEQLLFKVEAIRVSSDSKSTTTTTTADYSSVHRPVSKFLEAAFKRPMPKPGDSLFVATNDNKSIDAFRRFELPRLANDDEALVEGVDLIRLLKVLGTEGLIRVFQAILFENSILLTASRLGTLSFAIQALTAILYPFSWPHTLIPVLPASILQLLESPSPFIVGLLSSQLKLISNIELNPSLMVVHLDSGQIYESPAETFMNPLLLPRSSLNKLKTVLNDALISCNSALGVRDANLMIAEAFLHFFVECVGHYRQFLSFSSQTNEFIFRKKDFRRAPHLSRNTRRFLRSFTKTLVFNVFIDQHSYLQSKDSPSKSRTKTLTTDLFDKRVKEFNEEKNDVSLLGQLKKGVKKLFRKSPNFIRK